VAREIEETPVLKGKDAERFLREARENESGLRKVSSEDYKRAAEIYARVICKARSRLDF